MSVVVDHQAVKRITIELGEMLATYCPDLDLLVRIRASMPAGENAVVTDSWPIFERSAATSEAIVVVLPGPVTRDEVHRLTALRRRLPLHPLILALRRDAENLRLLSGLGADEVLWTEELDRQLWTAVRRARADGTLRRFASEFEEAEWMPVKLRQALAAACRTTTPVHTVPQLAALVGRDRRTLWRLWQGAFGPTAPLRPQDFVHWILLIHAATLRATGRRWTGVAVDLGVHEHTIARLAKSLADLNLRELAAGGPAEVARRFDRNVVQPLIRSGKRQAKRSPVFGSARAQG